MESSDGRAESLSAKAAMRRALLAARRGRDPLAAGSALLLALAPLLPGAQLVASYVSVGSEPSTSELNAALLAADVRVLLPVLLPGGDLSWTAYDGRLAPADRGLLEPVGERLGVEAIGAADLVVVPALAVDRRGVRLGRGGGSYDRALPRAGGQVVALLYDGELVDVLPSEPHDSRVALAATPAEGLVRLAGGMYA